MNDENTLSSDRVRVRDVTARHDWTLPADTPCVAPPDDLAPGETRLAVRPATGGGLHLRYRRVRPPVGTARVTSARLGGVAPGAQVFVELPGTVLARWLVWALVVVIGRAP